SPMINIKMYLKCKMSGTSSWPEIDPDRIPSLSTASYIHTYIHTYIHASTYPSIHPSIHPSIQQSCLPKKIVVPVAGLMSTQLNSSTHQHHDQPCTQQK